MSAGPASPLKRGATVVVVGASLAGLRACEALRKAGHGGRVVVIDGESRPFYDRPPLSKQFLAGEWTSDQVALRSEVQIAALDLELRVGVDASALDTRQRRVLLANGEGVDFDALVVATGAVPRTLPDSIGAEASKLHYLRTFADAHALREALGARKGHLLIIGGGFLGLEVAASARALGVDVSVVEPLSSPLQGVLGPAVAEMLAELHHERGVELLVGTTVERVVAVPRECAGPESAGAAGVAGAAGAAGVAGAAGAADAAQVAYLANGRQITADTIVVAIGVLPNTAWLEGSGLSVEDGVVCDETLFAGPGIVAAGDVARFWHRLAGQAVRIEHWTNAARQGEHAARSLIAGQGAGSVFDSVPYFWSDHYDLKIQALGFPDGSDDVEVVEGSLEERSFIACYGREGRLKAVVGAGRARQLMSYLPLLARQASFGEGLDIHRKA